MRVIANGWTLQHHRVFKATFLPGQKRCAGLTSAGAVATPRIGREGIVFHTPALETISYCTATLEAQRWAAQAIS